MSIRDLFTGEVRQDTKEMITKFLKNYDEESYIWILILLNEERLVDTNPLDFLIKYPTFEDVKKYIEQQLNKLNSEQINIIIDTCDNRKFHFTSSEALKEIKNNSRLNWWLINKIDKKIIFLDIARQVELLLQLQQLKKPYLVLLYLIYSHEILTGENLTTDIKDFDHEFNKITSNKINLNKYMNDTKFQEWAYHYIRNQFRPRNYPDFTPQNNKEYKDYILGYFDVKYSEDKSQYENDINKLKKAWQQKVYRDKGNTKKTYHLPLTKKAKTELAKLAKYKNQSENSVLEDLIHNAFIIEMCYEDGSEKY